MGEAYFPAHEQDRARASAPRPSRRGRVLFAIALFLAVLLVLVFRVPAVTTRIVDLAFQSVHVLPNTRMNALRVEPAGALSWRLVGWRWMRGDTLLASADTVRVGASLGWLWNARAAVRDVEARGVLVTDALLRLPDASEPDEPASLADFLRGRFYTGPAFAIGRLRVRGGRWVSDTEDGPGRTRERLVVRTLDAKDVVLGPAFGFELDSLDLTAWPRAGADSIELDLKATLDDGRLGLRRVTLRGGPGALDLRGHAALDSDDRFTDVALFARSQAIDLAALEPFVSGAGLDGRLEVDVELRGPSPARLSGHVRLEGTDVRVREIPFADLHVAANVLNGRGDGTFAAVVEGAPIEGSGWVRPGASLHEAVFEVHARAERLPTRWPGVSWWPDLVRRANARVELMASNDSADANRVRFGATANGAAGRFAGEGVLDLSEPRTWTLDRLDFEGLDLARLTGQGQPTALHGTMSGRGGLATGDSAQVDLRIALAPSRIGDWEMREARAQTSLRGAMLRASIDVTSEAGSLTARSIEGRIDGEGPLRLGGITFEDLDLARLVDRPDWSSRLDGTLDGSVHGLDALRAGGEPLAALRDGRVGGEATVRLSSSRLRATEIDRGDFDLVLANGVVHVRGSAVTSGGDVELTADARPFDSSPTAGLERARFERLDLAVWSGDPRLESSLTGTIEGEGRIALDPDSPAAWQARLELAPSAIARTNFAGGRADVAWSHGRGRWDAAIFAAHDTVAIRTTGTLVARADSLAGEARVTVPLLFVARAARPDTSLRSHGMLVASVRFAGRDPSTLLGEARVSGRGAVGEARLDTLGALLALREGILRVDTLLVRSNAGVASGGGAVALFDTTARPPALHVEATLTDASRLRPFFGADSLFVGSGTLALTLEGPANQRTLDASGELRAVAGRQWSVFGATLGASGTLRRDFTPSDLTFDAEFRRLRAYGARIRNGTLQLAARNDSMRFDFEAGPDTVHRAHVAGEIALHGRERRVRLLAYDARTDSSTWSLVHPTEIDFSRDRVVVHDFDLRSERGSVVAKGTIDRTGEQDFHVAATNVDLAGIFAWIGRDEAAGRIDGTLELLGPATAPRGTATFRFGLVAQGQDRGVVRADLAWNGLRADVRAAFTTPQGDSLGVEGSLPLAVALVPAPSDPSPAPAPPRLFDGDIDLRVIGHAFPLASIAPFLGPSDELELAGTLDVDVRVEGSGRSLSGSGRLDVANATLVLDPAGVDYRQVEVRTRIEGDRWLVEQASAMGGSGRIDAKGTIRLASVTNIEPELTLHAEQFELVDDERLHAVASGEIEVSGTIARPKATGRVTIEDSSYEIVQSDIQGGDRGPEIRLTSADVRQMQEVFGFERPEPGNPMLDLYEAAELDLQVTLEGGVWVRQRVQPSVALPLTGEFRLRKEPRELPRLDGEIEAVAGRGSIEQFGRTFKITEGSVFLHGLPTDHRFEMHAEFSPPSRQGDPESEAVIRLDLSGRLEEMKLTLSSTPAMSQTEIVAFLATGQSRTLGQTGQPNDPGGLAADIGLAQATGFAQSAAQEAIGLDVLQVRFDPIEGATLVAGTYVDSKLYVGFVQPFQSGGDTEEFGVISRTSIELEHAVRRWLVLNLLGETSQLRSFIRVRHAY
jgi:translocation and assembly module TamB